MSTNLNHTALRMAKLTLLHSERPKLHTVLAFLSAIGLYSIEFLAVLNGIGLQLEELRSIAEQLLSFEISLCFKTDSKIFRYL